MFGKKKNEDIELAVQNGRITEDAKIKAAYALNLCTVSISQIVDYNDINILEQEYEAILNNLNLENIPKDEALLKILKQILDTITFFRIQEGDKKFIERDYQQKLKNAIWSSVPNLSVIVATGNPFVALGALATQVGIGYMNYRKEKAKITNEHEKEMWELQKSAIEQFNALRRELFDTAWRLADRYNFKDCYRLTEKQIQQYNEILMDSDTYRKYERLYALKDNFKAYPPFWYYYGDSAAQIANEALEIYPEEKAKLVWNEYSQIAKDSFEEFRKCNNFHLLRDDSIASSCCLEYIDFLSPENDKQLITQLLSEAMETAGNQNDIIQLCAMNYLKIKEYDTACELLRRLVVEQYNTNTNAQLLSQLYLNNAIENNSLALLPKYEILQRFVEKEYLYPFPNKLPQTIEDKEKLFEDYKIVQRKLLLQKFGLVFNALVKKYSIELNKKLQNPNQGKNLPDEYFQDSEEIRGQRFKDLKLIMFDSKREQYSSYLSNYCIGQEYLRSLNNFAGAFQSFDFLNKEIVSIESIARQLEKSKNVLEELDKANMQVNNMLFGQDQITKLFQIHFSTFIEDYMIEIAEKTHSYVESLNELSSFVSVESELRDLCIGEGIQEPDILFNKKDINNNLDSKEVLFSSEKYLSNDAKKAVEYKNRQEKQLNILKKTEYANISLNFKKVTFNIKGTIGFNEYISKNKKHFSPTIKEIYKSNKIIAILDDKTWGNHDFIFTADDIYICHRNTYEGQFSYTDALNPKKHYEKMISNISNISNQTLIDLISELKQNEVHRTEETETTDNVQERISSHDFLYSGIPNKIGTILDRKLLCDTNIKKIDYNV